MKRIRLGLAAAIVAAGAVMAFGAGSASAATTELCETALPCSAVFPAPTTFAVTGEFGINPITGCEFTYKFTTAASSGAPLPAKITSFTFTHCGTGYTVTPIGLNWGYAITVSGSGPAGTGKMTPILTKVVGFTVNGGGEINCEYTAASFPQSIAGGGFSAASGVALAWTGGTGCVTSGATVSMGGFSTPKFWVTT